LFGVSGDRRDELRLSAKFGYVDWDGVARHSSFFVRRQTDDASAVDRNGRWAYMIEDTEA